MFWVGHLGRECAGRVIPSLVRGFRCASVVRTPGVSGVIVGVNINSTISGAGGLSGTIRRLALVSNRGPIVALTGGSVTTFHLHRNVPVNAGIALHNREVCSFLSGLMAISLPHMHSFHKVDGGSFSNHKGCALNVGRRLVFPRISCSEISGIHNVSVIVMAATGASRRSERLLARLKVPFRGWTGRTGGG